MLLQIGMSVALTAVALGKYQSLKKHIMLTRRLSRDVMSKREVLTYYLERHDSTHTPLENIYTATCERVLKMFTPDVRNGVIGRTGVESATLTEQEMGLVKSLCEHVLDEQEIRIEKGMGLIAMIVALAPMLGLLGTVWGVLDAFAEMGAAGSATIATMAPAISSALVTTVVGLLVAIPGVMTHTFLNGRIRGLLADMEGFAYDLLGRVALEFLGREG